MLKEAANIAQTSSSAALFLLSLFTVTAVISGVVAIKQRSLKGMILAIICPIVATYITHLLLF